MNHSHTCAHVRQSSVHSAAASYPRAQAFACAQSRGEQGRSWLTFVLVSASVGLVVLGLAAGSGAGATGTAAAGTECTDNTTALKPWLKTHTMDSSLSCEDVRRFTPSACDSVLSKLCPKTCKTCPGTTRFSSTVRPTNAGRTRTCVCRRRRRMPPMHQSFCIHHA